MAYGSTRKKEAGKNLIGNSLSLENKLSSDRIPKFIQEVDELPRTINNKIKTNYSVDLKV